MRRGEYKSKMFIFEDKNYEINYNGTYIIMYKQAQNR